MIIRDSQRSFASLEPGGRALSDPKHASFTLVAVDGGDGRLLGTASLFAYHGMPDEPHYYLRVVRAPSQPATGLRAHAHRAQARARHRSPGPSSAAWWCTPRRAA